MKNIIINGSDLTNAKRFAKLEKTLLSFSTTYYRTKSPVRIFFTNDRFQNRFHPIESAFEIIDLIAMIDSPIETFCMGNISLPNLLIYLSGSKRMIAKHALINWNNKPSYSYPGNLQSFECVQASSMLLIEDYIRERGVVDGMVLTNYFKSPNAPICLTASDALRMHIATDIIGNDENTRKKDVKEHKKKEIVAKEMPNLEHAKRTLMPIAAQMEIAEPLRCSVEFTKVFNHLVSFYNINLEQAIRDFGNADLNNEPKLEFLNIYELVDILKENRPMSTMMFDYWHRIFFGHGNIPLKYAEDKYAGDEMEEEES